MAEIPLPPYGNPLIRRRPELICWDCEESHPIAPTGNTDIKGFHESLDTFRWVHSECEGRNYE